MLNLQSHHPEFDFQFCCYHVVCTRMSDCLQAGKSSQFMTNTNSDFSFSNVGRSSTVCLATIWS